MKQCYILIIVAVLLNLVGCTPAPLEEAQPLRFLYRETVIEMGAEAAPVLQALGKPRSYTEEASCAFDGVEKTYCYGSFYLTAYAEGGEAHIARLWFADDSVSTQEGVYIGASRGDVRRAYGEALGEEDVCILVRGSCKLTILLENGVVASIRYDMI